MSNIGSLLLLHVLRPRICVIVGACAVFADHVFIDYHMDVSDIQACTTFVAMNAKAIPS